MIESKAQEDQTNTIQMYVKTVKIKKLFNFFLSCVNENCKLCFLSKRLKFTESNENMSLLCVFQYFHWCFVLSMNQWKPFTCKYSLLNLFRSQIVPRTTYCSFLIHFVLGQNPILFKEKVYYISKISNHFKSSRVISRLQNSWHHPHI